MAKNDGKIIGPVALVCYPRAYRGKDSWGWKHLAMGQTFGGHFANGRQGHLTYREVMQGARMFAADNHSAWTSAGPLTNEELRHVDEMRRKVSQG